MVKISLALLAVIFSFITISYSSIVSAQNVVTTINLNPESDDPESDISVLPLAVGVSHRDNRLYVITTNNNTGERDIVVIDSLSNEVIDTIGIVSTFGLFPEIKINPVTRRLYVSSLENNNNDKILVINENTNRITTTIQIDDGFNGMDVNSITNRIYVVNKKMVTVTVIDGQTNEIIDVIKLQDNTDFLFRSGGIKVNPVTNTIYVLKNSVETPLPEGIRDLVGINPDFTRGAKGSTIKEVIVIDGSTNRVIETVKLDFNAIADVIDHHIIKPSLFSEFTGNSSPVISTNSIEINPLTNRIYINVNILNINLDVSNAVLVMDGLTNNVIDAIDVGGFQGGSDVIAVNPRTNRIYLNDLPSKIRVIDGSSRQVIATIKTGVFPYSIKADPFNNLVYVANIASGDITIINDEGLDFPLPTLTVTPDTTVSTTSFQDATITLLDQNGVPLERMNVSASTNSLSATVSPRTQATNHDGIAVFKFRFNSNFRNHNRKITFTANHLETTITNED